MKPNRIIFVRHGQSEGNVDVGAYTRKPDYAIELTDKGKEQAFEAGRRIAELVGTDSCFFYVSPYFRTRQTSLEIEKSLSIFKKYEDPRLREQEWGKGSLFPDNSTREEFIKERDEVGHFYYRFAGGESCADVFDRVSDFLNTLFRDFEKPDYPRNAVIVTHGMTMRVLLMRWLHYTVEEFELLRNPKNCGMYNLVLNNEKDKFELDGDPSRYAKRSNLYV